MRSSINYVKWMNVTWQHLNQNVIKKLYSLFRLLNIRFTIIKKRIKYTLLPRDWKQLNAEILKLLLQLHFVTFFRKQLHDEQSSQWPNSLTIPIIFSYFFAFCVEKSFFNFTSGPPNWQVRINILNSIYFSFSFSFFFSLFPFSRKVFQSVFKIQSYQNFLNTIRILKSYIRRRQDDDDDNSFMTSGNL